MAEEEEEKEKEKEEGGREGGMQAPFTCKHLMSQRRHKSASATEEQLQISPNQYTLQISCEGLYKC
ncbi:hypothetical protein E2C01_041778 [Portunus trituberculatus]|uniref:Uncharacterized protein n=1 Tax=Portunus trituberculatus TaxID=210409 RepID=A0A5B7FUM8_PORTR|nr:hypothetical protein [Portunus trituberculatus]